ncbi:MAG: glycosyltransferase family 4 protein [Nitrospirae bacterium]|nr:glycosyltransferase family 4 protein [Nitrospirota bacterium]
MLAEVSAATVIGGAERVLREQALGLHRQGHKVSVLARAPIGDLRSQASVEDVVEYRYPVSRRNESAFVLSSVARSVHAFDHASRQGMPDVVIVHQSLAGLGPILRHRRRARAWVYVCLSLAHEEYLSRTSAGATVLQRIRHGLNARVRRWCEHAVMRRCERVVVLSEFMKRRVLTVHGIPEPRLLVIPGAADPVRFRPAEDPKEVRRRLALPLNRLVLFTVRNLVPRMGLENLLRALASLREDLHGALVLIGGEGPLQTGLERLIQSLGLGEQVRLLGFVPESELPRYYQAADLVLMPTHQLEGFGLVTVEALACGTPVLGTPVGAIPEVLARVDPELVTDGTDAAALAAALRRILRRFRDQPGERARLSAKGRALVEKDYTWTRHSEQLEQILRDVCGGP